MILSTWNIFKIWFAFISLQISVEEIISAGYTERRTRSSSSKLRKCVQHWKKIKKNKIK